MRTKQLGWLTLGLLSCAGCASSSLGCSEQPTARRREICEALADHSELGLAIKSLPLPEWQNEADAIEVVYCELAIGPKDIAVLESMRRGQSRLAFFAEDLYELVDPSAERTSPLNDPKDRFYRLRAGCPGE